MSDLDAIETLLEITGNLSNMNGDDLADGIVEARLWFENLSDEEKNVIFVYLLGLMTVRPKTFL